jgi:hypothetical protein
MKEFSVIDEGEELKGKFCLRTFKTAYGGSTEEDEEDDEEDEDKEVEDE